MAKPLSILLFCLLAVLVACTAFSQDQALTIGGTGSSISLIDALSSEFHKQHPEITLKVVRPPLGSGGSLKALSDGRIDLAIPGRPLKPEESALLGQTFKLADTPFVMASRDGQKQGGFTLKELAEVYAGTLQQWDSGMPIRLVLRASTESDTLQLRSMSPELATAVDQAAQRSGMVMADNDLDTMDIISNTPGSLGPTTFGLLTTLGSNVSMHPLNGVAPTLSNLKNGSYPWCKTFTVALPKNPSPAALAFSLYLRSDAAKKIMLDNNYLPYEQ